MAIETVAILMPGDMGHGCAVVFREHGLRVITDLSGRSERTAGLAEKAGLDDVGSLVEVARQADLILSILPPERALAQAEAVGAAMSEAGAAPPYADCNAVSATTSRRIGTVIGAAGALYIDAGILGWNPVKSGGNTRFYASGPDISPLEALDGKGIVVRSLGAEIGTASSLKMIYASATKGTFALHTAVLTAAHSLGLTDAYLKEIEESRPAMLESMRAMVPRVPLDAGRWIGEMHEIAATFAEAGVTPKFHEGAADIMELADRTPIASETRETVDTSRTLEQALDMYVAALGQETPGK